MQEMDVALICKALGDANRLKIVKMLSEYGGTQYATAFALVDKIAYVEAVGDPNNNADMVIQLKDKNVNALKQIVNFIKEFAGI